MFLTSVVGGAGAGHRASGDGSRRPRPAALIGVQQVKDALPALGLAGSSAPGDLSVTLSRTSWPAGRKAGIFSS
jgi:hypothetical protein